MDNSGSVLLVSRTKVHGLSPGLSLDQEVSVSKAELDLVSDLDVRNTEDVKMCIQMIVKGFPIR